MSILKHATVAVVALSASSAFAGDPYAGTPDVLAAYKKYYENLNSGNSEASAAAFAEKAYVVAGDTCTPESPCQGVEAVKDTIQGWVGIGLRDNPIVEPQVLGNMLVSPIEITWDGIADMGIERILGTNFIEAENGQITRKIFIPDSNDQQTKKYLKIASGQ